MSHLADAAVSKHRGGLPGACLQLGHSRQPDCAARNADRHAPAKLWSRRPKGRRAIGEGIDGGLVLEVDEQRATRPDDQQLAGDRATRHGGAHHGLRGSVHGRSRRTSAARRGNASTIVGVAAMFIASLSDQRHQPKDQNESGQRDPQRVKRCLTIPTPVGATQHAVLLICTCTRRAPPCSRARTRLIR
jgi:hypothetical protein